ncbi:hypothetical protein HY251_21900 [bacterium]|nr:hypothetical protein [bacterium]
MPLRYEVDQHDIHLKRYKNPVFPVLSILNADGSVVATPTIPRRDLPVQDTDSPDVERTVRNIETAVAVGKKADRDFEAAVAKLDLSKPEDREDLIKRHIARADADRALEVYRGFDEADASEARFRSLDRVGSYLVDMGSFLDADSVLAAGESVFSGAEQKTQLVQLRHKGCIEHFKQAYVAKDRKLCLQILDEISQKFPWSDAPQKLRKLVDEKLPP